MYVDDVFQLSHYGFQPLCLPSLDDSLEGCRTNHRTLGVASGGGTAAAGGIRVTLHDSFLTPSPLVSSSSSSTGEDSSRRSASGGEDEESSQDSGVGLDTPVVGEATLHGGGGGGQVYLEASQYFKPPPGGIQPHRGGCPARTREMELAARLLREGMILPVGRRCNPKEALLSLPPRRTLLRSLSVPTNCLVIVTIH